MLQAWHDRIDPLPKPLKAEVIKRLNQLGLRKSGFCRHTFEELDSTATYIKRYGNLLNSEQVQGYILDRHNDVERSFIDLLVCCKDDKGREKIHQSIRSELQRTRRAIIGVVDEVIEATGEEQ